MKVVVALLQFVLISTLEIFESQEHCLHDWSQVVTVQVEGKK